MDCVLQSSSTLHMDKYLQANGYGSINKGDNSGHSFRLGSHVIGANGNHFCPVSPITLQTTQDSGVQNFQDLDREMHSTRPFRGVHLLAYTDDMYPVVLPTRSRHTFMMEQLSRTVGELAKPLPQKDSLLSRDEYVKAQSATVNPAPNRSDCRASETDSDACGSVEAAGGACPFEAARGGQEMDSRTEVEVAPHEPAPSQGAFRPLWVAPQTGGAQAVMEQLPVGIHMKAQKKMPPPFLSEQECHSPSHSCTESFELGGDDVPPLEDCEESDGWQLQTALSAVLDNTPQKTEGTSDADATTASTTTSRLPAPQLTEDGRVLPPCTVECFPAPHPDWVMEVTHKDLNDCLLESLPAVQGVTGNRSTTLLSLDFGEFIPKGEMNDSQARLRTAANIQVALRKALVHPDVEGSLLPPPTDERHPGLVTIDDLRCLSPAERKTFEAEGIKFFFPILQGHLVGGPKIQQYLLACLVFGWYPSQFRQKKVAKEMKDQMTFLADRIKKYDGGLDTFQSCNSITMCPFKDCLFICSSQYSAVKHAMLEHYHTSMVCGFCLCYTVPSFLTNVMAGRTLISFKDHVLMCGSSADPSLTEASAGTGLSARSTPVSTSSSVVAPDGNASAIGDAADGADNADSADDANGAGNADGAGNKASAKHNLAAILGDGAKSPDIEEETARVYKKRNRAAVFGGQDDSKGKRPSKRSKKAWD